MDANPDKLLLTALMGLGRITREDWAALPPGIRPAAFLLSKGKVTATHIQEAIGFVATRIAVCKLCGRDHVFPQAPAAGSAFACQGCRRPFTIPQACPRLTEAELGLTALVEASPASAPAGPPVSLVGPAKWTPFVGGSYLMLLLILPVMMIDCGFVKVTWNGLQVFRGSEPSISGMPNARNEMRDDPQMRRMFGTDAPEGVQDPLIIAVPILGAAILACWALKLRTATAAMAVLALGVFGFYAIFGFRIERVAKKQMEEAERRMNSAPSGNPADAFGRDFGQAMMGNIFKPTNWFWLGMALAAATAASAFYLGRREARGRAPP